MVGDILPGVEKIVCRQLDDHTVNEVLTETRMRTLIKGVFDQRVTPLVNAMAANREKVVLAPQHGKSHLDLPKESEDGFFFFSHKGGCAEFLWIGLFHTAP